MKRAQLRALYVQASAELRARRLQQAVELFDDLLTLEPGYRDAAALRDTAQHRLDMSRAYSEALAAEEAGDWLNAADGFAAVQDDPAYPDAAARRQDCERRQRIADLQGELRYHSSVGSWEAVTDVSKELATLDPNAADPDGLTTAAMAEIEKAKPQEAPEPESVREPIEDEPIEDEPSEDEPRGSYTAADLAPAPRRPGTNPTTPRTEAPAPTRVPPSNANLTLPPTDVPTPLKQTPLAWGGAALAVAGGIGAGFAVFFMWFDVNYWQDDGGDIVLRILYGLLAPLGYLLLTVAGLPDRTAPGRLAMAGVVVSQAIFGLAGLNYTVEATAVVGSFAVAVFGLWAGVLALRVPGQQTLAWLLLLPTVLQPIIWIQGKGVFMESWYMSQALPLLLHLMLLCGVGIAFIVNTRRPAAAPGSAP